MSERAVFPIFVFEGNDLSLFDSFEALVTGLEGVDVEDGAYKAYDSCGRAVVMEAQGVVRGRFVVEIGTVAVRGVDEVPSVDLFESDLRSFLQACSETPAAELPIEDLVRACIKRAR